MKSFKLPAILAFLTLFIFGCCGQQNYIKYSSDDLETIHNLEKSTVVLLNFDEEKQKYSNHCAGVFISETKILTARHCAESFIKEETKSGDLIIQSLLSMLREPDLKKLPGLMIPFKSYDNRQESYNKQNKPYFSIVIGYDPDYDVALLQSIDLFDHPYLSIEENIAQLGQPVDIIGHPGGLEYTYSKGYIAHWRKTNDDLEYYQVSNGMIFYGSSGGAMINKEGKILGICSSFRTDFNNTSMFVTNSTINQFLQTL